MMTFSRGRGQIYTFLVLCMWEGRASLLMAGSKLEHLNRKQNPKKADLTTEEHGTQFFSKHISTAGKTPLCLMI